MTEAELAERDLRIVAFHEAGHHVAASAYGGVSTPRVWRNAAPADGEKLWLGNTTLYVSPGAFSVPARIRREWGVIKKTPQRWAVRVGLAGFIAEEIYSGESDNEMFINLCYAIEAEDLSQTDRELIGYGWLESDVAATIKLLRQRWERLQLCAAHLIEIANDGQASRSVV
jgi:hypothetical protein